MVKLTGQQLAEVNFKMGIFDGIKSTIIKAGSSPKSLICVFATGERLLISQEDGKEYYTFKKSRNDVIFVTDNKDLSSAIVRAYFSRNINFN